MEKIEHFISYQPAIMVAVDNGIDGRILYEGDYIRPIEHKWGAYELCNLSDEYILDDAEAIDEIHHAATRDFLNAHTQRRIIRDDF